MFHLFNMERRVTMTDPIQMPEKKGPESIPSKEPQRSPQRTTRQSPFYVRDCEKCGCPLGFGRTHDNKTIPLDLRAPIYCITGEAAPHQAFGVVRTELCYVSHFSTCPAADAFSKGKR